MKNKFLKILLLAVGYFALIAAVTFILSRVRADEYHFNWLFCAIGGVMLAIVTACFPSNKWR